MIFKQIPVGPMQNFNYLIGDETNKVCAIVDPAFEEQKLYDAAEKENLKIEIVLLTHTHADHIEALGRVVEKLDPTIYVHKNELSAVEKFSSKIKTIDEGDTIMIGDVKVDVLFTPGHTPGGVTFKIDKKLITGDALFVEACGRIDLPGGEGAVLKESLKKLAALPEDYEVYPGHDYGSMPHSTIKHEKENNPYMS